MAKRTGRLEADLLRLPWFDFLLSVRCAAEDDRQIAAVLKGLEGGFVPNLSVTHFAGGVLGALVFSAGEGSTPGPAPTFTMNEVSRG